MVDMLDFKVSFGEAYDNVCSGKWNKIIFAEWCIIKQDNNIAHGRRIGVVAANYYHSVGKIEDPRTGQISLLVQLNKE